MILRKATQEDIPFIIKGIFAIENTGETNTFSNMFETDNETTYNYLEQFFLDEENFDTEFSLNTYTIAEIDGQPAGMCALIFTDSNYYQNKGELFPIHLNGGDLISFIKNAKLLPDTKIYSENKYFIEYIFVDDLFRNKGIAKTLILDQLEKIQTRRAYLNVLKNNSSAIKYYNKLGFQTNEIFNIDNPENKIYPCIQKIILYKDLEN